MALTIAQEIERWDNPGWVAPEPFIAHALALAALPGEVILECGSGLTTLLLAEVARESGRELVALEHDPDWAERVETALAERGCDPRIVRWARLKSYGDFDWYEIDWDWQGHLPSPIDLVVCDGPPGNLCQGRIGLFSVLGQFFASGATVLLDDAHRPGEADALVQWGRETRGRAYSVLTLP